jgi:hypothetical protein
MPVALDTFRRRYGSDRQRLGVYKQVSLEVWDTFYGRFFTHNPEALALHFMGGGYMNVVAVAKFRLGFVLTGVVDTLELTEVCVAHVWQLPGDRHMSFDAFSAESHTDLVMNPLSDPG